MSRKLYADFLYLALQWIYTENQLSYQFFFSIKGANSNLQLYISYHFQDINYFSRLCIHMYCPSYSDSLSSKLQGSFTDNDEKCKCDFGFVYDCRLAEERSLPSMHGCVMNSMLVTCS